MFMQRVVKMMLRTSIISIFLVLLLSRSAFAQSKLPDYSNNYDPGRDAIADGVAALALAKKTNRRVLIEVGGDWCSWCHILDRFIANNHEVRKALHRHFVLLKVNYSEENFNEAFLKVFPKPLGFPHMYITDEKGGILYSKDTAELLDNSQYSGKLFLTFLNKWKKP